MGCRQMPLKGIFRVRNNVIMGRGERPLGVLGEGGWQMGRGNLEVEGGGAGWGRYITDDSDSSRQTEALCRLSKY